MFRRLFAGLFKALAWLAWLPFGLGFGLLQGLFGGQQRDPVQDFEERTAYAEDREADREASVLEAQADARRAMLARILAEAQSPAGLDKSDMEVVPEPENEDDEEEQKEMQRWTEAAVHAP